MRAGIFAEENRKWLTLAAVSFGLFMIMLDNTVVNVALPSIQRDLDTDLSQLQWIVTGYALTFAVSSCCVVGTQLKPPGLVSAALFTDEGSTSA